MIYPCGIGRTWVYPRPGHVDGEHDDKSMDLGEPSSRTSRKASGPGLDTPTNMAFIRKPIWTLRYAMIQFDRFVLLHQTIEVSIITKDALQIYSISQI